MGGCALAENHNIIAVEEEMQLAVAYYRSLGQSEAIVHEQFQVIDEVRDCRILFDKLQDTLSASWELMYSEAVKCYSENGDLEVPKRYVTANGYTLGSWLATQRLVREGKVKGNLTEAPDHGSGRRRNALGERAGCGLGKALRRGQGLLRGKWASAGQYFPKGLQRRQPRRVDL